MKTAFTSIIIAALLVSCSGQKPDAGEKQAAGTESTPEGAVIIARDIVTEIIVRPDPDGDPWEAEKVKGYQGEAMINSIFDRIYNGSLTVYDYHTGETLSANDIRKTEKEFNDDRSKIGKLSFTEDWLYYPAYNRLEKVTKSVVFGYELYNNQGKVYAYRAAFQASLTE